MRRLVAVVALGTMLALMASLVLDSAQGQDKPKKQKKKPPRVASVHVIMEKIVFPNCKALGAGLKKGDTSEEALHELAESAALLNEAGFILMQNKRCPSKTWAQAAARLRRCSAVVYEKLEAKDLQGAQNAFKAMTQACKNCHDAHKDK